MGPSQALLFLDPEDSTPVASVLDMGSSVHGTQSACSSRRALLRYSTLQDWVLIIRYNREALSVFA